MAILLSVVAAVAAVALATKFSNQSATALGKVSAVIGTTAVIADAWNKVNSISRRLADSPTAVALPSYAAASPSREVVRRDPDDEFLDEHPSLGLTGGLRGYDAYRRRP